MPRYVILPRFLREIPATISIFRQFHPSAWLTTKKGFLHGVDTPDPATWSPKHGKEAFPDDKTATTDISDDTLLLSLDNDKDRWSNAGADGGDHSSDDPPRRLARRIRPQHPVRCWTHHPGYTSQ